MWNTVKEHLKDVKDCVYKWIEPVVNRKRKIEESNESPPNKQIKLDHPNMLNRGESFSYFKSSLTSKESLNCDEDDECMVVNLPKKKWEPTPNNQRMARRSIRSTLCEVEQQQVQVQLTKDRTPMSFASLNHKDRSTPIQTNENKDPEVVHHVKHNSSKSKNNETIKEESSVKHRIFQFPTRNNQSRLTFPSAKKILHEIENENGVPDRIPLNDNTPKHDDGKCLYSSCIYLNLSYRYQEKRDYYQLLKAHSSKLANLGSIFPLQQLGFTSKQVKPSIPIVDLTKDKSLVIVNKSHENVLRKSSTQIIDLSSDDSISSEKKSIPRVNSLDKLLKKRPELDEDFVSKIVADHVKKTEEIQRQVAREARKVEVLRESNSIAYSQSLEEKLQVYMRITRPAIDEVQVEEEQYVLPELTDEQENKVNKALVPAPAGEILVENFGLQIKRRDIQTLKGLNWLNDEIINFYMSLIMERGKAENMPKVHAFNTFFYPKLLLSGHTSLKRWTKKVDIFSHDMVLVPVHLGMHWCMSVIDFRNKQVRYYDSMGSPNDRCLQALLSYLEAESLDKKKKPYDTNDWEQINVDDIPQQMNGSDCGVFSCMFAEHLARDSPILFTQDHMPYFRRKMILEILETKLLT